MSKGCVSGREGDGHKYKGYSCSLVDLYPCRHCSVLVCYTLLDALNYIFFMGKDVDQFFTASGCPSGR